MSNTSAASVTYRQTKEASKNSRYKKEFVKSGQMLASFGCIDEEIAEFFGCSIRTLHRWKKSHPDFGQALERGKDVADNRVEESLYKLAVGYKRKRVKVFFRASDDDPVFAEYIEDVAPDVAACIFWLKNRKPHLWRERKDLAGGGEGGPDNMEQSPLDKVSGRIRMIRERIVVEEIPENRVPATVTIPGQVREIKSG